jgi:hypothetical protein
MNTPGRLIIRTAGILLILIGAPGAFFMYR